MSRGIGALAKLVLKDENTVMYEYGCYNLNDPAHGTEKYLLDGLITIPRDCFAEPEMHEKIKKMPSGRKKRIIKRIPIDVDYGQMVEDGKITVENCSNTWYYSPIKNIDIMAFCILERVFRQYQEEGDYLKFVGYDI